MATASTWMLPWIWTRRTRDASPFLTRPRPPDLGPTSVSRPAAAGCRCHHCLPHWPMSTFALSLVTQHPSGQARNFPLPTPRLGASPMTLTYRSSARSAQSRPQRHARRGLAGLRGLRAPPVPDARVAVARTHPSHCGWLSGRHKLPRYGDSWGSSMVCLPPFLMALAREMLPSSMLPMCGKSPSRPMASFRMASCRGRHARPPAVRTVQDGRVDSSFSAFTRNGRTTVTTPC